MIIIAWNCRGIAHAAIVRSLRVLCALIALLSSFFLRSKSLPFRVFLVSFLLLVSLSPILFRLMGLRGVSR